MCGIHLILDKHQKLAGEIENIMSAMLQASRHRGPDTHGQHFFRGNQHALCLGANRLRIIDPDTRADQPMQSEDGRYLLVFNGAIYNYFELRNELLGRGVRFATQSDTEVLLYWLLTEGKAALERLNGMFAFILYDKAEDKLLAARDRFGMKPLYLYEDEHYLLMSSETAPLLATGLIRKEPDRHALQDYLGLRYVREPRTLFEGIRQLEAGHYLETDGLGRQEKASFVREEEAGIEVLSDEAIIAQADERLTDAVLRHLQADVRPGLLLSGGVDSTLLLAIIQEQGAHPVPTFSVTNAEGESSYGTRDYQYAAKAAQQFGNYHYELPLQAGLLSEHWEGFMAATDQPVGDGAAFLTYLLSAEVKKVAGIALSGAGADELFAGYHRHQAFHQYLRHYSGLMKIAALLRKGSGLLPTGFAHPLRKQFRLLKKLGKNLHVSPAQTFGNFISQPLPGGTADRIVLEQNPGDPAHEYFVEQWLQSALRHDRDHYLREDVLHLSDRMSMARHLEMRLPYLDLGLACWVNSLTASTRMRHGRKWILRRLLTQKGGKAYANRPKEGFGMPLGQWLRQEESRALREQLLNREQYLYEWVSPGQVRQLLQAHLDRKGDHSQELWALMMLSAWLEQHFS